MSDEQKKDRSPNEEELEREIRKDRKFTLSEAIGRLAGPGAMKGASPVTRARQVELELEDYLRLHLSDSGGALGVVLHRYVAASELLLNNLDQPLIVLGNCIQRLLDSEQLLRDLVREADVEWGQTQGERPHFDREGVAPHPDDPYTLDSVRATLSRLLEQIASG